ncbi:SAM-dependent methyltransferase [Nonomuraea sp. B12E4]|uniref:SAM-dependent methyltransferase n=1 Tax=Nonomuraea sp. B12E4 TaxID=3153564 RepID=UPI00325DBC59
MTSDPMTSDPMTSDPVVPQSLPGIGGTALGVALIRALESTRPDRLFDDPYARHFIRAADKHASPWGAGGSPAVEQFLSMMADQVAVRTLYLDRALLDAARQGCGQVVLVACGMDARAYRLPWPPGTALFELDLAHVLDFKNAVLDRLGATATCHRVGVATDLRQDWLPALAASGFDPDRPTAWLAEGILYALSSDAAGTLLDRITIASALGSVLALDHAEDSELLRAARAAISAELVELWQGGPVARLDGWLAARGWRPDVTDIAQAAAACGRPTPSAFDPNRPDAGRAWLATARLGGTR